MAVQYLGEDSLAPLARPHLTQVRKTGPLPSVRTALDNKSAAVNSITIMMRVKWTPCGVDERLRQSVECLCGAVPDEFVREIRDRGLEFTHVGLADN